MRPRLHAVTAAARRVVHGLVHDHAFHYAAGTAFRATLAVFPLVLALVSLLGMLGLAERASDALGVLGRSDAVPGRSIEAVRSQLDSLDGSGGSHTFAFIAAMALAIWSGAAAFRTIATALNESLDLDDHRGLPRRFAISAGLAALTAVLATAATLVVAFGPVIGDTIREAPGGADGWFFVWNFLKWPAAALSVFAWLAATYSLAPATPQRFRLVTPGICVAFVAWLAFAVAFSWYIDEVGNQGRLYGAFAGLIAFQLYVYWSALIVLLGAQIDSCLRRPEPVAGT